MKIKYLLLLSVIISSFSSCQEKIDLVSEQYDPKIVIDGKITNQPGPYTVKISKSVPVNDPKFKPYPDCNVKIIEKSGSSEVLTEVKPGIYKTSGNGILGKPGNSYRLVVKTPKGKVYKTDFKKMKAPVAIDTAFAKIETQYVDGMAIEGYQFYVTTKKANSNDTYFLWSQKETYEYTADYKYGGTFYRGKMLDNSKNFTYRCWKTQSVQKIFTEQTQDLRTPKLNNFPLNFVTGLSKRLQKRYSLLIEQYVIDKETYEYWNQVRNQINKQNFLNAQIPYQIEGNIYNPSNEDELILGNFTVASVSKVRLFIDNPIVKKYFGKCAISYDYSKLSVLYSSKKIYFGEGPKGLGVVSKNCVDCKESGGAPNPPDYW